MKGLFDVSGKTVVISGGSSGIGAMMAQGFLEHGAKVFIMARKAEALRTKAEELGALGECVAIPADLSSMDGITQTVDQIRAATPTVDVLVNNAGANWAEPLDRFQEAGWDKVMNINIKSMFFTIQKMLPLLNDGLPEDPARIINIASVNGLRNSGLPTYAYSASKSAVIHLTGHLGTELAPRNITVNAIAPGLFASKMTKQIVDDDEQVSSALDRIPLGRLGSPNDIAGTSLFLASKASAWMTGQTVVLDGGMTAAP
ncbi:MAG: glucose 1-dehydrogenase [Pseudomonadota bacterium]